MTRPTGAPEAGGGPIGRRDVLQAGTAIAGGAVLAANTGGEAVAANAGRAHEFQVRDLKYLTVAGKPRLARLYQPAGTGPFPALLQIHGGAWYDKDRTDGQHASLNFAASGIVVLAIDFRNGSEAPYPASQQDINYGIRWLKAHAREFGSSPDRVGAYGTSSGGHQALLAALKGDDPTFHALPLPEAPRMSAHLAFVVSGWGVLFPWERRKLAVAQKNERTVQSHDAFFRDEATHLAATPALILERGEKALVPPALVFQGTKDQWTTVEQAQRLKAAWEKAGGTMELILPEGERHTFVNEHPFSKASLETMEKVTAFIKRHGAGKA